MYIGNNRHNKKTTRDLNNAKGIDLSLHTTKQSIRAPVLYAYLLVPTPSLVSSLLVILNACVFHSQWKHSKYYAVCWISIVLFTSLFLFLLSFIFDCVCACVCVFVFGVYLLHPSTSEIACYHTYKTHNHIYKIQMYKWLGFNTESLACIRFTSWKIKNNLFTVICMYCVWCVCTFSLFYHLHLMFIVCYMWAWWQWYEVAGEAGRPWWPIFAS